MNPNRFLAALTAFAAALMVALMSVSAQQPSTPPPNCNAPMASALVEIAVPGLSSPMMTRDGCWMFDAYVDVKGVTGVPDGSGITVRRRQGNTVERVQAFPLIVYSERSGKRSPLWTYNRLMPAVTTSVTVPKRLRTGR